MADTLRGWMSEQERLDLVLAIGEAVSNAVHHGGGEQFAVRCWSEDGKILVDVTDEGAGFSRRPIRLPVDGGEGGYGLSIIHKLTDEVHLLDGGRRIRLVKRLSKIRTIPNRAG